MGAWNQDMKLWEDLLFENPEVLTFDNKKGEDAAADS
jgi:hypothetical protein